MTVTITTSVSTALGNGAATVFPYQFNIPTEADARVLVIELATGAETLIPSSNYLITGLGSEAGGEVTFPLTGPPLSSDFALTIFREMSPVQQVSITNQTKYFADVSMGVWDRLTLLIQDTQQGLTRAPVAPVTYEGNQLRIPVPELDRILIGTAVGWKNGPSVASVAEVSAISTQVVTVAGVADEVVVVASIAADVLTVASIEGEVQTVASVASAVFTVAGIEADVQTVAANIVDVQNAGANAQTAVDKAQEASDSSDLAERWATEAEDVVVVGGEFSAKHYAAKAAVFDPALYLPRSEKAPLADAQDGTGEGWMDPALTKAAIDAQVVPSAITLLSRTVISGSPAAVDFLFNPNGYDAIRFVLSGVVPSTDTRVDVQTSNDGGASFATGASDYITQNFRATGGSTSQNRTTLSSGLLAAENVSSVAGRGGMSGNCEFFNVRAGIRTKAIANTCFADTTDNIVTTLQSIERRATTVTNAVRFFTLSGTFTSGIITMYGVRNT